MMSGIPDDLFIKPEELAVAPEKKSILDGIDNNLPDQEFTEFDMSEMDGVEVQHMNNNKARADYWTTFPFNGKKIPIPQRWHPMRVIKNIVSHNKLSGGYTGIVQIGMCLTAGSKVVLADGSIINIENLGNESGESLNTKIRISETETDIASSFYKFENRSTIEIVTSGGKSVRGTPNHPLLVNRNGNIQWVELQDIKMGDELQTVSHIPCNIQKMAATKFQDLFRFANTTDRYNGIGITKTAKLGPGYIGKIPEYVSSELASLMGYIVGDGWVRSNDKGVGFIVSEDELDLLPILLEYGDSSFGIKPRVSIIKPDDKKIMIGDRVIKRTKTMTKVNYESKPIARMLSILKPKRIPEMVFCSPNPILSKFLSWYFEADGSCINFKTSHRRIITVDLTSINIELLRDVQLALLRFGIQSKIKQRNKEQPEAAYKLTITRKESLIKFFAYIGFQSIKKRKQSVIALGVLNEKSYQRTKYREVVTEIKTHSEPVTVYDIHVPKSHRFITNGGIVSHNSGGGKTTITKSIIHGIHELGEHYIVRKFSGQDTLNIDKIINSCVVGQPHILVFDDASYTLADAKRGDAARLANALTTIRHTIKARVITIMNIHYSKAMLKFFRNQHFTFLVTITPEEIGNYAELFKQYMPTINAFSKQYYLQMTKGWFSIPTKSYSGQHLIYHTNRPFRLCLVAEITDLHFMLYAPQRCDECDPEGAKRKLRSEKETLEFLMKAYDPGEVRTCTSFFAMIHGGKNYLPKRYKAIWNHWLELARNGYVDWEQVMKEVDASRKQDHHRVNSEKKLRKQSINSLLEDLTLEQKDPAAYKAKLEAEKAAREAEENARNPPPPPPSFDNNPDAAPSYGTPDVKPDFSGTPFEGSKDPLEEDEIN